MRNKSESVANISETTMREARLRWLGHSLEKDGESCNNENMVDCNGWKIGRPKLRWSRVIRQDMKEKGVERRSTSPENVKNENSMSRP